MERLNYRTNWHDSYDENVLQFKTIIAFFKKDLEQFLQEVNAEYSLSIPVGETSFVDVSDAEESDTENLEDDDLSEEEERVPELTDRFKSFTKKNSHQRRNTVHRLVGEQDPTLRVLHDGTQGEEISKLNESLYRHNHETFMDRMIPWDRLRKSAKQAAEQASVDSLLERIKQGFQKGTNFKYLKEKIVQFALLFEGVEEDVRQYYIERDLLPFIRQQYLLNQIDFTQAIPFTPQTVGMS